MTIYGRYEIQKFGGNEKEMLGWVKELGAKYDLPVGGDYTQAFNDGKAFASILKEAEPEKIDLPTVMAMPQAKALQHTFDIAEKELGVPQLLEARYYACMHACMQ